MKKKKMSPKSIIFYKLYLVNIVITVVFICMIAIICSAVSYTHLTLPTNSLV